MLSSIPLPFFLRGNNMDSFLGSISDFYGTAAFPHNNSCQKENKQLACLQFLYST